MSRQPPPLIELSDLGTLATRPDFPAGGQSTGIWRIPAWPGYLFKRFNTEAADDLDVGTLDRLIAQPARFSGTDRVLVAESTAWPVSRVVDEGWTIGVVIPEAPDSFAVSRPANSNADTGRSPLHVSLLAKSDDWLAKKEITPQTTADRMATCSSLAQVACLFESCDIVYADWSYTNAFWQPEKHTVFVLDIDSCSYRPRKHVSTLNFEDPLTPAGQEVDKYTDRYRVALLLSRMLTGERDVAKVHIALRQMSGDVPATLLAMLTATDRIARPSLADLVRTFGVAIPGRGSPDATGVPRWREIPEFGRRRRPGPDIPTLRTPVPPSTPSTPLTTGRRGVLIAVVVIAALALLLLLVVAF